jgi:hypothetical protein
VAKKEVVNFFKAPSFRQGAAALLLVLAAVFVPWPAPADTTSPDAGATNAASAPTNASPKITTKGNVTDIDEEPSDDGKKHIHMVINDDGDWWVALLIPLAGIVGTFGMPIAIVAVVMYFNYRRRRETLATVREYLNKGLPVPPELLEGASASVRIDRSTGASCDRRRGLKLTFIGLGVAIALYINDPHGTDWGWGLIPAVIGVGYLLSAWMQGPDRPDPRDPNPPPKP